MITAPYFWGEGGPIRCFMPIPSVYDWYMYTDWSYYCVTQAEVSV